MSRHAIRPKAAHRDRAPGEPVGMDSFYVGRMRGTAGAIWQLTAIDVRSSYAWAELVSVPSASPAAHRPRGWRAGWQASSARRVGGSSAVLCDNGQEFCSVEFGQTLERLGAHRTHIHAGRPQTNGHVEALHETTLDECLRPAFARYLYPRFTGPKRELESYLRYYNFDRSHYGRLTQGAIPATSSTVPERRSRDEPKLSASSGTVHLRPSGAAAVRKSSSEELRSDQWTHHGAPLEARQRPRP